MDVFGGLPTVNPAQPTYGGDGDSFVAKLDQDGTRVGVLDISRRSKIEQGWAVAVDSLGKAVVSGWTFSEDFPTLDPSSELWRRQWGCLRGQAEPERRESPVLDVSRRRRGGFHGHGRCR